MSTNWIQNKDGSVYHLKLKPGELAKTIITVGDPERVTSIANRLDSIEKKIISREFHTITGFLSGKLISIISTGIGTDNVDIVLNEIDAIFNLDLEQGIPKQPLTSLTIVRLGTSGAIQEDINVDQILISDWVIGMDNSLSFYKKQSVELNLQISGLSAFSVSRANQELLNHFSSIHTRIGNTASASGFYASQGRFTRISQNNLLDELKNLNLPEIGKISNIEMETSMIYGLSELMGHRAISLNAILANRITNNFSSYPEKTIERMIDYALEKILILLD